MPPETDPLCGPLDRYGPAFAMSEVPDKFVEFLSAYEDARRGNPAPRREDLDMRRLARFLPQVTVMERPGPGQAVFRLMGTAIAERIGADLRGHNFLDYLTPKEAERSELGLKIVAEMPVATFAAYETVYASGTVLRGESITLPLDSGAGEPPYLALGFHPWQELVGHEAVKAGHLISIRWKGAVVIDMGHGLPGPSVIDILSEVE